MKYLAKSCLLFFLFLIISNINAQEKLTLNKAITIALNQNTNLVKSRNNLQTSEASVKTAYGNLLPNLSVSGGWSWQRVINKEETSQIGYLGNVESIGTSQTESRNYNLSVGGNITLFDGLSTFKTISQKENDLQSAKYDLEKLKQDIILKTVNYYVTILNYQKVLDFQEQDLKYNQDLLNKIKEMHDLKMISNADLYSQQYQTANSQLALIQAKNNFEKSKIDLLNYLSKDISQNYSFESDSSFIPETLKDLSSENVLYQTAYNNRSDYKSQKLQLENSGYQLSISRSGLYPTLSGSYGLSTSAVQLSDLFNRNVYNVGLSLNIPIFSRWNTEYSIESAKVQLMNSNEELNALERQIKSDVKSALLDLESSRLQLDVTKTAVTSSKETWSIKKEKYRLGSTTFIDQQQAYRDYIQAMNNSIAAESNYIYKQFSLMNAVGILNKY